MLGAAIAVAELDLPLFECTVLVMSQSDLHLRQLSEAVVQLFGPVARWPHIHNSRERAFPWFRLE